MGYTHYWYQPKTLNQDTFNLFTIECRKIIREVSKRGIKLAGSSGESGQPELDADGISFNGSRQESYESFIIDRDFPEGLQQSPNEQNQYFSFCKTAHKPYDLAVTACLIAFKFWFGDLVTVRSDGTAEEWSETVNFYNSISDKKVSITREGKTIVMAFSKG